MFKRSAKYLVSKLKMISSSGLFHVDHIGDSNNFFNVQEQTKPSASLTYACEYSCHHAGRFDDDNTRIISELYFEIELRS